MALADNIVGYWTFDENTGTTAADATGNANTGTLSASTFWTASGKINSGISTGTAKNVSLPANADLNITGALSIAAWIKTSAAGGVFFGGYSSSTFAGYGFGVGQAGAGKLCLWTSGSGAWSAGTGLVNDGIFHYTVVTYDGANVQFYIDGSTDGAAFAKAAPGSYSGVRTIGSDAGGGTNFTGTVDEVGIWSRALTSGEVAALYNSGAGLQYPFASSRALFMPPNLTLGAGGAFFPNPLT